MDELFNRDLYEPFEHLVSIEILGKTVEVPDNNRLLRCFQFLSMMSIAMGDFCWNGDCANCQVWYRHKEETPDVERPGLSCRLKVVEGMVITRMSPVVKIDGINLKMFRPYRKHLRLRTRARGFAGNRSNVV